MLRCLEPKPCGWFSLSGDYTLANLHSIEHKKHIPRCEEGTSLIPPRSGKTARKPANRKPKGE